MVDTTTLMRVFERLAGPWFQTYIGVRVGSIDSLLISNFGRNLFPAGVGERRRRQDRRVVAAGVRRSTKSSCVHDSLLGSMAELKIRIEIIVFYDV